MSISGMASVPAVRQYLDCAEATGLDYLPLLAEAGINQAVLEDNNCIIAESAMQRLVFCLPRLMSSWTAIRPSLTRSSACFA